MTMTDTTASDSMGRGVDTPSNFIPGLNVLGSTYNVLGGNYADPLSTMQQVVDWNKSLSHVNVYLDVLLTYVS